MAWEKTGLWCRLESICLEEGGPGSESQRERKREIKEGKEKGKEKRGTEERRGRRVEGRKCIQTILA